MCCNYGKNSNSLVCSQTPKKKREREREREREKLYEKFTVITIFLVAFYVFSKP